MTPAFIENYAEDCMPHMKSIHIKQKLNEYWKAHPDEIDALFQKIVTLLFLFTNPYVRSKLIFIIPFYKNGIRIYVGKESQKRRRG